mmetsp:Transcript_2261/g.3597  ORF Transcript_2261/g.3597 Transcript_2261/m.3597 type:complete len:257 (+) Transcript_2261:436-1206(+)
MLIDKSHAFFQTSKAALKTAGDTFNERIFGINFFNLLLNVRNNCTNGLNDCNNQGTKCCCTHMIPHGLPDRLYDCASSNCTLITSKIPRSNGSRDDNTSDGANEFNSPKETKDENPSHGLRILIVRKAANHNSYFIGFELIGLYVSKRRNTNSIDEPDNDKCKETPSLNNREYQKRGHGLNCAGSLLDNPNTQLNSFAQETQNEEVKARHNKHKYTEISQPINFFVAVNLRILISCVIRHRKTIIANKSNQSKRRQ